VPRTAGVIGDIFAKHRTRSRISLLDWRFRLLALWIGAKLGKAIHEKVSNRVCVLKYVFESEDFSAFLVVSFPMSRSWNQHNAHVRGCIAHDSIVA
jgi:hypothetical protein